MSESEPGTPASAGAHSSVDRVLDVVEQLAVGDRRAQSVSELSGRTSISRPALYRILTTLERRRWAARDGRAWRAGPALDGLGDVRTRSVSLIERARPSLVRLWEEYGETVNLGVPNNGEVLYLDILESVHGLRTGARVGSRDPLHATALGKVFLAEDPGADALPAIGASELPRLTPHTIVTLTALRRELETVAERGWAVDDEESEVGVRCVAAPIRDREGRAVAALSLSAPSARLGDRALPAVAGSVRAEASSISL